MGGGARREELGKIRRNEEEPGKARRRQRSQEEPGSQGKPGGARRSQEEPGEARRSQEEPGRARRSQGQEELGGARRSQEEPGEARRSHEDKGDARRSLGETLPPPPGSSLGLQPSQGGSWAPADVARACKRSIQQCRSKKAEAGSSHRTIVPQPTFQFFVYGCTVCFRFDSYFPQNLRGLAKTVYLHQREEANEHDTRCSSQHKGGASQACVVCAMYAAAALCAA